MTWISSNTFSRRSRPVLTPIISLPRRLSSSSHKWRIWWRPRPLPTQCNPPQTTTPPHRPHPHPQSAKISKINKTNTQIRRWSWSSRPTTIQAILIWWACRRRPRRLPHSSWTRHRLAQARNLSTHPRQVCRTREYLRHRLRPHWARPCTPIRQQPARRAFRRPNRRPATRRSRSTRPRCHTRRSALSIGPCPCRALRSAAVAAVRVHRRRRLQWCSRWSRSHRSCTRHRPLFRSELTSPSRTACTHSHPQASTQRPTQRQARKQHTR